MDYDPKRACRGRNMVHSNERYKDSNNNLGDVLLDLMHYALSDHGKNHFRYELDWAKRSFIEDTTNLEKSR